MPYNYLLDAKVRPQPAQLTVPDGKKVPGSEVPAKEPLLVLVPVLDCCWELQAGGDGRLTELGKTPGRRDSGADTSEQGPPHDYV